MGGRGSGAAGVFHQCKQRKRLHTYLLQFNHCKNSIRQMVPFRGIATARQIQSLLAMTYWYNHYKQLFPLRPPKLVHLKSASKLQTVRQLHQGWRGVANKGTSPRACGWEAYIPLCPNGRSGARHQPLATERRKRQGCGVVYLHNAPICTLAIPTSIASGTYRRLVLHLQPHNCEHICACLL